MAPLSRIVADRRLLVAFIVVLAVANLLGLVLVFGPLRTRVETSTQRAEAAVASAATAARELTIARQTSTGSVQAASDLQRFYREVLPADQPAARRITLVRLAQQAREANLSYDQRAFSQGEVEKDGTLMRAETTMTVYGTYRDLRRFVYAVETGPDFVVIDRIGVSQPDEPGDPLEASLTLSTYFKGPDER